MKEVQFISFIQIGLLNPISVIQGLFSLFEKTPVRAMPASIINVFHRKAPQYTLHLPIFKHTRCNKE